MEIVQADIVGYHCRYVAASFIPRYLVRFGVWINRVAAAGRPRAADRVHGHRHVHGLHAENHNRRLCRPHEGQCGGWMHHWCSVSVFW